jgi:hypothetical protein
LAEISGAKSDIHHEVQNRASERKRIQQLLNQIKAVAAKRIMVCTITTPFQIFQLLSALFSSAALSSFPLWSQSDEGLMRIRQYWHRVQRVTL